MKAKIGKFYNSIEIFKVDNGYRICFDNQKWAGTSSKEMVFNSKRELINKLDEII